MIVILVQRNGEAPWGEELQHSFRVVSTIEAETLETRAQDPADEFITAVVRVPVDLLETAQQIVSVNQ